MAGNTTPNERRGEGAEKGTLFFYPIEGRVPEFPDVVADPDEPFELAANYAQTVGVRHRLLHSLGMTLSEGGVGTQIRNILLETDYDHPFYGLLHISDHGQRDLVEFARSNGYDLDFLRNLILQAHQESKGIVIGLHASALDHYVVRQGNDGNDLRIDSESGIGYQHLYGIRALGAREKSFFKVL